jgi:ankyrin repeat protein
MPSPLMQALYRGDEKGAAEIRATLAQPDVFEAAALGEVETLRTLLDADASGVSAWSDDGFTPLHYAAFFGRPEAARLLLERGADPAAQLDDGRTPADLAAGPPEALALLA